MRRAALLLHLLATAAIAQEDLPDFSWAGYHAGRTPPNRSGRPTAFADLSAALARGGVIELPEGRFELTQVLQITRDRTVLRGAGSGRTVLDCPRSLTDLFGYQRGWSWGGGFLRVRPSGEKSAVAGTVAAATVAGATRLAVTWKRRPRAGEWLELRWFNDTGKDTLLDHLYGGVIPRERMGKELQASDAARVRAWVVVEEAGDDFLVIDQPLRIDLRPEWRPTLHRRPHIEEVGIEGLTIRFAETRYPGHLKERGYNAIDLGSAINCWVRDVRIVNADSGIFVHGCKRVTVSGVRIEGRTMHHCLSASWSQDCLFTDWRIEALHVHGTTVSWCAHGNVFRRGYGKWLAMDAHRAGSFMNLHTAIVIDHGQHVLNPFRSGGSWPRGPHAAKLNVYWNVENRFSGREKPAAIVGHAEWPLGVFVAWHGTVPLRFEPYRGMKQRIEGLNAAPRIPDLYDWQRSRRLGSK